MTTKYLLLILALGIVSCHSKPTAYQNGVKNDTMTPTAAAAQKPNLKSLSFDYGKDPACGMPLKAGLEDTAHYQGKLYGFCSKECKEAFLKEPATFLAEIKKEDHGGEKGK